MSERDDAGEEEEEEEPEEDVDYAMKTNCGVWTAIENFINKENNEMIWDNKNMPPKVSVTRKKEKLRVRCEPINFILVYRNGKFCEWGRNVLFFVILVEKYRRV